MASRNPDPNNFSIWEVKCIRFHGNLFLLNLYFPFLSTPLFPPLLTQISSWHSSLLDYALKKIPAPLPPFFFFSRVQNGGCQLLWLTHSVATDWRPKNGLRPKSHPQSAVSGQLVPSLGDSCPPRALWTSSWLNASRPRPQSPKSTLTLSDRGPLIRDKRELYY